MATGGSGEVVAAGIAQAVGSVAVSTAVGAGQDILKVERTELSVEQLMDLCGDQFLLQQVEPQGLQ